jgi:hypothetical protein
MYKMLLLFRCTGKTVIGLPTSDSKPDIALNGKGIER